MFCWKLNVIFPFKYVKQERIKISSTKYAFITSWNVHKNTSKLFQTHWHIPNDIFNFIPLYDEIPSRVQPENSTRHVKADEEKELSKSVLEYRFGWIFDTTALLNCKHKNIPSWNVYNWLWEKLILGDFQLQRSNIMCNLCVGWDVGCVGVHPRVQKGIFNPICSKTPWCQLKSIISCEK